VDQRGAVSTVSASSGVPVTADGSTAGASGGLAYTGTPVAALALGGLLALALGLGLIVLPRRRTSTLG
jgi:hypothetical protein